MEQCLLVIIATPDIEQTMVDWLLARTDVSGFSTAPVSGHGSAHEKLSMSEQVEGRQSQIMFHSQLPLASARDIVARLREDFRGTGLHYWIMPALEGGHID